MSNLKKILILGGYGNTGRLLAPLLLKHTTADIVLAGRNVEKANAYAEELKGGGRVTTAQVDAANKDSLLEAFKKDISMVIVASSTSEYVDKVTEAAIETKVDYYDIQLGKPKADYLKSKEEDITKAGVCFITDGGFHPGLPAALIRYLAPSFDKLEQANVGSVIQMDWKKAEQHTSMATVEEFAGEFETFQSLAYKNSEWKESGLFTTLEMDFGEPFGSRPCFPMFLEEMRSIPELFPSVTETGFYVGGFNWVVDFIICPIVLVAMKLFPKQAKQPMGRFMFWGMRFTKPPYRTLLKLEAKGVGKDGAVLEKTLVVSHEDGYALTAIPVVATVMQYLSATKSIRKPGLWRQALCVDPHQLLLDMQSMGVSVEPQI